MPKIRNVISLLCLKMYINLYPLAMALPVLLWWKLTCLSTKTIISCYLLLPSRCRWCESAVMSYRPRGLNLDCFNSSLWLLPLKVDQEQTVWHHRHQSVAIEIEYNPDKAIKARQINWIVHADHRANCYRAKHWIGGDYYPVRFYHKIAVRSIVVYLLRRTAKTRYEKGVVFV